MGNCQPLPPVFHSRRTVVRWMENSDNDDGIPKAINAASSNETTASPEPSFQVEHRLRRNMTQDTKNRNVFKYYEPIKVLGVGSMGCVTLVRKKKEAIGGSARTSPRKSQPQCGCFEFRKTDTDRQNFAKLLHSASHSHHSIPSDHDYEVIYALKTIHLNRVSDPKFTAELRNEIDIIKSLDHPNIVRAIETFEFKDEICFLMELCSGGDLFAREPYTEDQAQRIVRKTTSAVEYMHQCGIVHRGKPDVYLLSSFIPVAASAAYQIIICLTNNVNYHPVLCVE